MPLLSDSFLEMVMAAVPGQVGGGSAAEDRVEQTYRSPAHVAIGAAVNDARRTGRRAAVCLVDLAHPDGEHRDRVSAVEAAVAGCLRRQDQHLRVRDALLVVAPGLEHPAEGDRLVDRLRSAAALDEHRPAVVGMALYPVHGRDASALLDSALASAIRARLATPVPLEPTGAGRASVS